MSEREETAARLAGLRGLDLEDARVVEAYTADACWYLAWWMHRLSGLEMCTLGGYTDQAAHTEEDPWDGYGWVHAGVCTPDGKFLDITGPHDPDDAMDQWLEGEDGCEQGMYPFTEAEYETVVHADPHWFTGAAADVTRTLATQVLRRHGHLA